LRFSNNFAKLFEGYFNRRLVKNQAMIQSQQVESFSGNTTCSTSTFFEATIMLRSTLTSALSMASALKQE